MFRAKNTDYLDIEDLLDCRTLEDMRQNDLAITDLGYVVDWEIGTLRNTLVSGDKVSPAVWECVACTLIDIPAGCQKITVNMTVAIVEPVWDQSGDPGDVEFQLQEGLTAQVNNEPEYVTEWDGSSGDDIQHVQLEVDVKHKGAGEATLLQLWARCNPDETTSSGFVLDEQLELLNGPEIVIPEDFFDELDSNDVPYNFEFQGGGRASLVYIGLNGGPPDPTGGGPPRKRAGVYPLAPFTAAGAGHGPSFTAKPFSGFEPLDATIEFKIGEGDQVYTNLSSDLDYDQGLKPTVPKQFMNFSDSAVIGRPLKASSWFPGGNRFLIPHEMASGSFEIVVCIPRAYRLPVSPGRIEVTVQSTDGSGSEEVIVHDLPDSQTYTLNREEVAFDRAGGSLSTYGPLCEEQFNSFFANGALITSITVEDIEHLAEYHSDMGPLPLAVDIKAYPGPGTGWFESNPITPTMLWVKSLEAPMESVAQVSGQDQWEWEFTSAGATGRSGPSQSDVDSEYQGTPLEESVNIIGDGIQEWTVPDDGKYRITARGAKGADRGSRPGGQGAVISGDLELSEGDVLRILVGQPGLPSGTNAGGGGGGSFVTREVPNGDTMFDGQDVDLLLAAGGGGGAGSDDSPEAEGVDANTEEEGTPDGQGWTKTDGDIGTAGHGGHSGEPDGNAGGGGGGYLSDGAPDGSVDSNYGDPGQGFLNGGLGGKGGNDDEEGGFGGGASTPESLSNSNCSAGAGGGYSGGTGGNRESTETESNSRVGGGGGGTHISGDATSVQRSNSLLDEGVVTIKPAKD